MIHELSYLCNYWTLPTSFGDYPDRMGHNRDTISQGSPRTRLCPYYVSVMTYVTTLIWQQCRLVASSTTFGNTTGRMTLAGAYSPRMATNPTQGAELWRARTPPQMPQEKGDF